MSYNDSLKQSLVSLGYTDSIDDALNKFLQDRTDIASTATPDMMYAWLGGLGYTGSLPDRLQQHAVSSGYSSHAAQVLAGAYLTRYVYNMDGIDDRWALASRAINPDGDNTFEFLTPTSFSSFQGIICQSISATTTLREFTLVTGSSGLLVRIGGSETVIMSQAQGLKASTRYGLTLIGTTAQVFEGGLGGTLVKTTTFARGAAREPSANTVVGCIPSGAGFGNYFQGLQYDIEINGVRWPIADRNKTIQPSIPAGNPMTGANLNPDRWTEIPV